MSQVISKILTVSGQNEPKSAKLIEFHELSRLRRNARGNHGLAVVAESNETLVE